MQMIKNVPLISVIMSVYKEPEYMIRQSIESVLNQTIGNFEFIIILDNPEHEGNALVEEYAKKDDRINIIHNEANVGLTISLNKGLSKSRGKYIARMDADDISEIDRFAIQVNYMEKNEDVAVVGAYVDCFDERGNHSIGQNNCIDDSERNRIRMLFCNAGVPHSTAFIRKSFLDNNNIMYDVNMKKSQDYGLWTDVIMKGGIIRIIPEVLLQYRIHSNQITNINSTAQKECYIYNIRKQIHKYFNYIIEDDEAEVHYSIYNFNSNISAQKYYCYAEKLIEKNNKSNSLNKDQFDIELKSLLLKNSIKAIIRYKDFSYIRLSLMLNIRVVKSLFDQQRLNGFYRNKLKDYLVKSK